MWPIFVLSVFTLQTAFSFPMTRVWFVKLKVAKSEIDFLKFELLQEFELY